MAGPNLPGEPGSTRSPTAIAWRRFRHNPLSLLALGVLLLFGLTGLLGYLLLPAASTAANRQLPALAKRPPGSQAILLVVYRPAATPSEGLLTRWWQGTTDGATYLPVYTPTVRHQQGQLHYTGLEGQPEQRPLAPGEAYRIERVRFWLGTDAFGRDVLSRILLGTRVS
ncbi:MAG: hypothetical protein ACK5XP_02375, partial [Sphingobacteriia bacterium]